MVTKQQISKQLIYNPFQLKQKGMFTNKMIFSLIAPILIEQAFIVAIGVADTVMVSYVGEVAVAGISFLTAFNNLIKKILSALAIGGSIVISQYIGKNEQENAKGALKMVFYTAVFLALILSLILYIGQSSFLSMLAGNVEDKVMENARTYYNFSLFSYPFFAAYFVVSSAYRAMRNSRIPMFFTVIMMLINLALKALFIYVFKWEVFGAGLSTLISVMFIGITMVFMICGRSNYVYIEKLHNIRFDFSMIKRILGLAIPNSIENGMFQFGLVILQRLVASFGTAALAANAIAKSLTPLSNTVVQSISLAIVTIVGQCMGAGKPEQAVAYTKHVLKISYILGLFVNIGCILSSKALIGTFHLSEQASSMAASILFVYCFGGIFIYPSNVVLPNALRAAGDTKFIMSVSMLSMFGARIGLAYVLGSYLKMGVVGVWLTMQFDWLVRSAVFTYRFVKGKWKRIKVI